MERRKPDSKYTVCVSTDPAPGNGPSIVTTLTGAAHAVPPTEADRLLLERNPGSGSPWRIAGS
jgi:hypothetical protein